MATTTEIEPQAPVLVPPPNPTRRKHRATGNPVGRPAAAPDPDEDENTDDDQEAALSDEVEDWQLHCQNISQDDWGSQVLMYLKRISPTCEKRSSGRSIDVASYARPITLDDIKKEHGSGVYRLRFLRMTQPSGKFRKYRDYFIDVMDASYPPNLPYGEWVDRPENDAWKWAGPALLQRQQEEAARTGAPMPVANGGAGGAYPPGLNFNELLLRVTEANDPKKMLEVAKMLAPDNSGMGAVLTELVKMNDPTRLITLIQAISPPKQDNAVLDLIIQDRNYLRAKLDKMEERINSPENQPKTLLSQLEDLEPLIDKVFKKAGNQPWFASLAEKGVEQIPEVIGLIKTGMQLQQQRVPQTPSAAPQLPNPAPTPQQAPQAAAAAQPEPPAENLTDEQKAEQEWKRLVHKWGPHIMNFIGPMVDHFKRGLDGYEFQDWYLEGYGRYNWNDLGKDIGAPGLGLLISQLIEQNPQLRNDLAPAEKFQIFIAQFFESPEDQIDDPDDAPGKEAA